VERDFADGDDGGPGAKGAKAVPAIYQVKSVILREREVVVHKGE
jgi:hypothetical protein